MKTFFAKKTDVQRKWHLVDAEGMVLGRLASQIAKILKGKNKPIFTPHTDTGDFVIVVNTDKVRFTGKKLQEKKYIHHSGYPGGIKIKTANEIMKKSSERVLINAVSGMLSKNKHRSPQLKRLKVYRGPEHPHKAQSPAVLKLTKE
jgi:large subunit ribosomal protein L13